MANFRQIHTKIWTDNWFIDLEPDAKLLWIYLFSNSHASISGLYELPLKVIAFETDIDRNRIKELLAQFERDGKAMYDAGIIWVKALQKYNAPNPSPKVQTRIKSDVNRVTDGIVKQAYLTDTLSIPPKYPINRVSSDTETDTYTDKDTETEREREIAHAPAHEETRTIAVDPSPQAPRGASSIAKQFQMHTGMWPGIQSQDYLQKRLGDMPDWDVLKRVYELWVNRGYNPRNFDGMFDWYDDALGTEDWEPPKNGSGPKRKGKGKPKTFAQMQRENNDRAVEEFLSTIQEHTDDGK